MNRKVLLWIGVPSVLLVGLFAVVVLLQDLMIFPGALVSLIEDPVKNPEDLDPNLQMDLIKGEDENKIEVWTLTPPKHRATPILIFNGNGATLRTFFDVQIWLAAGGFQSYAFHYRGFGRSTGWPSEENLYRDSDSVVDWIVSKGVLRKDIGVVGISLGSGPAARVAAKNRSRVLLLLSPYVSLPEVARDRGVFAVFAPFLFYEFPTEKYVRELEKTCLIIVHGEKDRVIPASHSKKIAAAYEGSVPVYTLYSKTAGHEAVYYEMKEPMMDRLKRCL